MNTLKKIVTTGAVAILPLIAAATSHTIIKPSDPTADPLDKLFTILNTLTNWMLTGLIVLASLFVVYAAYNYLTSGGDPEKVGKAKDTLIYAAVAVAIGLLAKVVVGIAQALVK
jgi:hypothetical protein